ncbi:MAG: ATP-binding protein [Oculatellaceae cyanobacterium Prado106]|nr:ATP-binding protein [Oculatellaceae cyanobacterium Prado106]
MPTSFLIPEIYTTTEHDHHLFQLWHEIHQLPPADLNITLDFQKCTFLSHNGVAFLGGLAHFIQARGGKITFQWDTLLPAIRTNLAQNGFLSKFGADQPPWDGNSIPYRSDRHPTPQDILDYLMHKWLGKGWVNISEGLQCAIAGRVWEIYDNALTHSQSEIGIFSCGQHYPNRKELHLTLLDFGVGIPTQVRSLPQNAHLPTPQALPRQQHRRSTYRTRTNRPRHGTPPPPRIPHPKPRTAQNLQQRRLR